MNDLNYAINSEPMLVRLLDDEVRKGLGREFKHRPMIGLCAWTGKRVLSFDKCVAMCALILRGHISGFAAAMADIDNIGAFPLIEGQRGEWKDGCFWAIDTLALADGTRWLVCADDDFRDYEEDDPQFDPYRVMAVDGDGAPLGNDLIASVSALVQVEPRRRTACGHI